MNAFQIAVFLLRCVAAGLVGTAGMTGVMAVIDRYELANAKMIIAIGSLLTKSLEHAKRVGLIMHCGAGVCFAVLYGLGMIALRIHGILASTGTGLVCGFVHGFAMSFILVIAVAEHHPLPEFRETGFAVAVAHVIGHVVYGLLVGLVLGLTGG